jgi:hypothetical protein
MPRYQKESSELIGWLQSALERLDFWNNQAVVVPQEMETRRDHLSTFLVSQHIKRVGDTLEEVDIRLADLDQMVNVRGEE